MPTIVPLTPETEWLTILNDVSIWTPPLAPTVVLAPHPDDETLSAGGLIAHLRQRKFPVLVVAITNGENAYSDAFGLGDLWVTEQVEALRRLRIPESSILRLSLPDREVSAHEERLVGLLSRYTGPTDSCWLANTDADCEVPLTWLRDQLLLAKAGHAAVAGIVDVDSFAEHEAYVRERFRLSYLIHADGTHPHVHGANLGVRADAYLSAGGWQDISTAEDHDLWCRLQLAQQSRVADASLCVSTSGRRIGRAPSGFAEALAAHNEVTL